MGQCHAQSMSRVHAAPSPWARLQLEQSQPLQPEGSFGASDHSGPWCCAVSGCTNTTNTVTASEASDFKLPASRLRATASGAPTSSGRDPLQHGLGGDQAGNVNSAQPPDSESVTVKHLEYGFDFALTQEEAGDSRVHEYFSTKWM